MSRKTQEDQSTWQMPSIYAFVGEYGPYKVKGFDPIENTLVWLYHSGESNDDDDENTDPLRERRHPMYPLVGQIQDVLLSSNSNGKPDADSSRFSTVLVIDICDMFESPEDLEEAMEMEDESLELTKKFGKKLLRLFQKLLLHKVALGAQGKLCGLLLKLYTALQSIDATYQLEENNTVAELWLLHPKLSTKYVNTHLVVGGASSANSGANAASSKKKKKGGAATSKKKKGGAAAASSSKPASVVYPVQLNLVYASSESNKIAAIKSFFPNLGMQVLTEDTKSISNWCSLVAHRSDSAATTPAAYEPERCNDLGKMLFCAHMRVEMNKFSKQYERNCSDATAELLALLEVESNEDEADMQSMDWSSCERHVGALLLRGNRCVLVRSPEGDWEGLRIPSVVPHPHESPQEAAIRAVTDLAEVDASEMQALPHVLPVAIYAPNGRPILVELYPLYAASPPPGLGEPDYELYADEEDEDDLYDWYTFPRALARLDPASVQALQCMAMTLVQAASVGLVPSKWGGVFGQEQVQFKQGA